MTKTSYNILAIFLPFFAIYLYDNTKYRMKRVIISLILSFVFWIPAVVYAFDIINDMKWFYPVLDSLGETK